MLEGLLDPAGNGQGQRFVARPRVRQPLVERALDPSSAVSVDIGVTKHMRGKTGLRVQPVGLAIDRQPRFAKCVGRLDDARRGPATQVEERLVGSHHRIITGFVALGHQSRQRPRQFELVADDLSRVKRDGPGVDRSGEWLTVAIDDVPALGDQRRYAEFASGMVAERSEIDNSRCDQPDHPDIDQHSEHQALVHHRQYLATLADQTKPLGLCDETGRWGVHCGVPVSLVWAESDAVAKALPSEAAFDLGAGSGASVSTAATLNSFAATGLAAIGLAGFAGSITVVFAGTGGRL